jgi:hypothetical protein
MREATARIELTARQLSITDQLVESVDEEYRLMRQKLLAVPSYPDFLNTLYQGQVGRQMVLGDLFEYMVTGRGYWLATQTTDKFKDYIRIMLYLVNLLLIQESVFSFRASERRQVMQALAEAQIEGFFDSPFEQVAYQQLQDFEGRIEVRGLTRELYKTMDTLTPKPLGVAIELIVYIYLLNRHTGYVVPLLLSQRLFGGRITVAPPDYLVLQGNGHLLGVEVGGGMGQYSLREGKIDQANLFIQETGIPVITAGVPHIYRCETCECWLTFCNEIVERTANGEAGQEKLSCLECPTYDEGRCPDIIYYGQVAPNGERRRHHYHHFITDEYVRDTGLRTSEARHTKLLQYFPVVKGLEVLPRQTSQPSP